VKRVASGIIDVKRVVSTSIIDVKRVASGGIIIGVKKVASADWTAL
jgi:hypothetical protein